MDDTANKTIDITALPRSAKAEIAAYIKDDTLAEVNARLSPVQPRVSFYTKYGKRTLDVVLGLAGFLVTLPFNAVIGIVTFFDVGTPIIYKQQRGGYHEELFTIYKFRNMTNETDSRGELLPAAERLTKWGRFVRMTSLDELLNFISILKGDMSVIGPRPMLDRYIERLCTRHKAIYLVRPGLECPALHKEDDAETMEQRLDNYVWYVENCSFVVDVRLFLRLVSAVFDRKSAKSRSSAQHGGIMGYNRDGSVIDASAVPTVYVERFFEEHGYSGLEEAVQARNAL